MEDMSSHSVNYSGILAVNLFTYTCALCSGHFSNGSVPQCQSLSLARMVPGSTGSGLRSCGVANLQRNSAMYSTKALQRMLMCGRNEVVSTAEQQVAHSYDCILTNACTVGCSLKVDVPVQ